MTVGFVWEFEAVFYPTLNRMIEKISHHLAVNPHKINRVLPPVFNTTIEMKKHYLKYFHTGKGICGDDFKNDEKIITININFILSLSELQTFELPFSGKYIGTFASLTMSNNDVYYLKQESYLELSKALLS